jgi:hypothetical protein
VFPPQEREEATTEAAVLPDDQETARGRSRDSNPKLITLAILQYHIIVDPIAETYKRLQQKDDNTTGPLPTRDASFCESQRVSDLLAY